MEIHILPTVHVAVVRFKRCDRVLGVLSMGLGSVSSMEKKVLKIRWNGFQEQQNMKNNLYREFSISIKFSMHQNILFLEDCHI